MKFLTAINEQIQQMPQGVKSPLDVAAVSVVLFGWLDLVSVTLTIISTFVGLVWLCIRVYETQTVQEWLKKRRDR